MFFYLNKRLHRHILKTGQTFAQRIKIFIAQKEMIVEQPNLRLK